MISSKFFNFIDTPGHGGPPGHGEDADGALKVREQAIKKGFSQNLKGVINVVSYGYHEGEPPAPAGAFDKDGVVSDVFLGNNRQREIDALAEWTTMFAHPKAPSRLMTVVTKADLWWHEKDVVLKHYRSGKYFKSLGPAQNCDHVVVSCSSVFHKFYGKGATDGSFDQEDRGKLRNELLRQLLLSARPKK
jgi:hypothetical protein